MKIPSFFFLLTSLYACGQAIPNSNRQATDQAVRKVSLTAPAGKAIAGFASGCFWCVEEIFEAVPGVDSTISGYAGSNTPNPTYETVSNGTTGHAESVLVYYDPKVVSYEELLRVFFVSHDPTTPNQQGPDVGSQYRSVAFYQNATEKNQAEQAKVAVGNSKKFSRPVVTEISPLKEFYRAEEYHQDYVHHHPDNSYVVNVSTPRFEQFRRTYAGKLKPAATSVR
ncbi:MAG: peptide-methionine (S)-S-oxide reductase MsrA [Ferruginibacter sp.]|nr:peptide-methionine (S)-S-oxide reductase MsrA [Cytophagales bacterium]